MKAFVLEMHNIHGIRHEVYVPGVGVFWLGLGEVQRGKDYSKKIERVIERISNNDFNHNYTLLNVAEVPDYIIKELGGWIKSREISNKEVSRAEFKLQVYLNKEVKSNLKNLKERDFGLDSLIE